MLHGIFTTADERRGNVRLIFGWIFYMAALTLANVVLFSLPPIISLIKQAGSLSGMQSGFLMSAAYGGAMAVSPFGGAASNRYGVLAVMVGSLAYMGLMVTVASLQPNFLLIFLMMLAAGVGYALLNPAINQGLLRMTPAHLRGTGMSLKQMGITAGGTISALVLPPIALQWGWKAGLLSAGLITFFGALALLLVAYLGKGLPGAEVELNVKKKDVSVPLRQLLRHPVVMSLSLSALLLTLAQMSFFMNWALYLEEDYGLGLLRATQLLAVAQGAGLVGRMIWGSISDGLFAKHRQLPLQAVCLVSALMMVMLYLNIGTNDATIWMIGVVLGFNLSGWGAVYQTALVESVPPDLAGPASGVSLTAVYTGLFLGPILFGWLKDIMGNYSQAWGILFFGLMIAFVVLSVSQRLQKKVHGQSGGSETQ